ncbi:MAG: alpha/beta hydrolase [Smithella sp.]
MSQWFDGYVTSNGIKIHYYRTGGDKPKVVFSHGAGDDGLCFTRIAKELEKNYDLIMPDARGHGKSDIGSGDYSTKQRVADLVGFIKELKLDRPIIGGHSMGADTSMNLAAEYPDMVRAIYLEDPPLLMPGETFGSGEKAVKMEDVGKMMVKFMRTFKRLPKFISMIMARKVSPTYPDDEIIPWVNSKRRVSNDFLNSMDSMGVNDNSPVELFTRINVPVLLIIGDKSKMSIVSEETASLVAGVNPKVKVARFENASHDIRRTRFDGYMPALSSFLAENYK